MPESIGRYEIISELGKGGMAVVYLAHDPNVRRQVAVKVLPHQFTFEPQFRSRFHREAEAIAGLEHPAIVPVYDYGEVGDQPYIVMRYMPGGSLADRMVHGPLALGEISTIVTRLAGALDAAHQRGMVHRDLKPGNILFDQWREAYLSDFGIVKLAEAASTFTTGSAIIGTPAYMSPEQAKGKTNIDGRSDVYSLAVILFELLTRQLPYEADTPMGQAVAHIVEPVPNILDTDPTLPPIAEAIIRKALAKDPDDRYPTAHAFASAVSQLATSPALTPPAAAPPTSPPPARPAAGSGPDGPRGAPTAGAPAAAPRSSASRTLRKPVTLAFTGLAGLIVLTLVLAACIGGIYAYSIFSATATPTVTNTSTATPTQTASATSSATATATNTATDTDTPTATLTETATATNTRFFPTATPAPPTSTPLPQCPEGEFFDPFMNRCRRPDSNNPPTQPPSSGGGPTSPPTSTAPPTPFPSSPPP